MTTKIEAGNLLPIHSQNGKKTVDARQLHQFVDSKQMFANWIKSRIKEYGFVLNQDYVSYSYDYTGNLLTNSLDKFVETDNQVFRIEYEITVGMGKELAMVEKSKKGRMVRQYLIEIEEKWQQMTQPIGTCAKVYPLIYKDQIGIPRRELLLISGYSPNSGTISRLKKLYPNDFFTIGRTACVSVEFARLRFEQGKVRQLEFDFREGHKAIGGSNNG